MHMAVASGTPDVALFGPTNPIDWGPWGDNNAVVRASGFTCQPCNRDGCGGSKVSDCLHALDVGKIMQEVGRLLRRETK